MNICVCGIGRAGQAMIHRLIKSEHKICGALVKANNENIGANLGDYLGVSALNAHILSINDCVNELKKKNTDLIIDFSNQAATKTLISISAEIGAKLVICTTNHSTETIDYLKEYTKEHSLGVVYAPNLTLGINLLIEIVSHLSLILPDFDFEIVERHCKSKPRGTMTANIISNAIGRGDTHISSVRAGGYVGIHEVTCANENERITIVHESFSRQAFAYGAMLAADFIKDKTGFFVMKDVINDIKERMLK